MTRQTFIFNANGLTGAIIPQRIGFEGIIIMLRTSLI